MACEERAGAGNAMGWNYTLSYSIRHTHTHCSHHTGGLTPHYMASHEVLPRQDTSLAIVGIHYKVGHRTLAPADTINSGTISEWRLEHIPREVRVLVASSVAHLVMLSLWQTIGWTWSCHVTPSWGGHYQWSDNKQQLTGDRHSGIVAIAEWNISSVCMHLYACVYVCSCVSVYVCV